MLCPFCREKDTSVVDSRPTEDGAAIRRRRVCGCERKERFTTFERVQFRELTVIKSNDRREPFDRDKVAKSITISLRKRPIDSESIEKFISKIVRNLEGLGENEIPTSLIGKFIMEGLANLDQVAYVRFASVYKNFKEAKDFEQFIGNLNVYKTEKS
jgi:transcriptional repressor NrdR